MNADHALAPFVEDLVTLIPKHWILRAEDKTMKRIHSIGLLVLLLHLTLDTSSGQDESSEAASKPAKLGGSDESSPLFQAFAKNLTNVELVGQFTIDNSSKPLREERYEIHSVAKAPKGDYWLFQARIKYGEYDVTLPLPLEVKWAGKTPVITLDNVTIPVLGTFSARVVIDGQRYAGTWTHGEVGGHMFGKIQKQTKPAEAQEE
jgi:hypothetical protein